MVKSQLKNPNDCATTIEIWILWAVLESRGRNALEVNNRCWPPPVWERRRDQIFHLGKDACEKDMLGTYKKNTVGIKNVNKVMIPYFLQ